MEKELSHYLQKFAIHNQPSKRCESYPTLPYVHCKKYTNFSLTSVLLSSLMENLVLQMPELMQILCL